MTDTQDRLEERLSEPGTKAGKALYDAMRESAAGLPERLAGKWPYRDAILAIEEEAALRQSQDIEAAALDVELVADVMKREFGIPRNSTYRVITAALASKAEEAPR